MINDTIEQCAKLGVSELVDNCLAAAFRYELLCGVGYFLFATFILAVGLYIGKKIYDN